MRTRTEGFTLIELLVVIAIIAILAAILFPVILSVKASALTANCESNIKQLGMAMQLYSEASDGRLPRFHNGLQGLSRKLWWDFISPYLRADRIYRCPALTDSRGRDILGYGRYTRVYGYGVPYPHLFNYPERSARLSAVPRPTRTLLVCDSYTIETDPNNPALQVECGYPVVYCECVKGPTAHSYPPYSGQRTDGNVAGRHGGRSDAKPYGKTVVLYCDLHTRAWPKEYVMQEYSSRQESNNSDIWGHFDNIQK